MLFFSDGNFNFVYFSRSGLLNFSAVALSLNELGYRAVGIRIDSGDLAYLSNKAREMFEKIGEELILLLIVILIFYPAKDVIFWFCTAGMTYHGFQN